MTQDVKNPTLGASDLAELMASFNDVTAKLERTHATLRAEVSRLTRELRDANEQLERSRRLAALGEMAAGIAHEIRNPLGGIALYARLLEQDLHDRPERKTAAKIRTGVARLNEIVTDVLTFARELRVAPHPADVEAMFDQARGACVDADVEVRCDVGAPELACDEGLIVQALVNLVRNAGDAVRDGGAGGRIELSSRKAPRSDGAPCVVLAVTDQGPGIEPEVVERMFNPFFTTRAAGTGLGLAIVHRIADAHGGSVRVFNNEERAPGARGATVELWLPAGAARSGADESEIHVVNRRTAEAAA